MRISRRSIVLVATTLLLSGCSKLGLGGKPAGFRVSTNATATVFLDGKDLGSTPFESTDLKTGKYAVKVVPDSSGSAPFETSLKLYPGYMTQVDWNFNNSSDESFGVTFEYEDARDKTKAEIQLTASPDNVPVLIDGKNLGFTPLLVDSLAEGDHNIVLVAPGYSELTRTVKFVKGIRTIMTGKLAKNAVAPSPTELIPVATSSAKAASVSATKATPTPKPTSTPKPSPTASTSATKATATPIATSAAAAAKPSTATKPYVEILTTPTGWLRVRESANTTAKELAKLDSGATVPYANASASGWLKVKYDAAAMGWVSSDYAKLVQ